MRKPALAVTILTAIIAISSLSGCATSLDANDEPKTVPVGQAPAEKEPTPTPTPEVTGPTAIIADPLYHEPTAGFIQLPDGRQVVCVATSESYEAPISCDWEHVITPGE